MPILSTENLNAGYGRTVILENVNIRLAPGQILTLIGPNGAGKSTLLATIAGRLAPLGGTVFLKNEELSAIPPARTAKTLAVMTTERQDPELMTCREVVSLGRYPYTGRLGITGPRDREIIEETMALTEITDLADRDFTKLSDGQRQRVLLARAICQDPEVLILDEPSSFLDIRHKLELLGILKDLVRRKNIAVLMALHEIDLAQKFSDVVLCVADGKIDRAGKPDEILTESYIRTLYGMTRGRYLPEFGSVELPAPEGRPSVFVIGGGGSGIPVYRALAREGCAFYTGILHESDLDFPVARALAAEVVGAEAYEPFSEERIEYAKALMKTCTGYICTLERFGTMNRGNEELKAYAESLGLRDLSADYMRPNSET
ncbi:MAG: ABC transporter ATP-binding protein [Lachnospiraceae bacterium]|nr:ABC transporter ATP-binding protein [Lachnospiraceae bacterium]